MKLSCNGTDLSNAANVVSKALAVNKNIPVLEGIKLNAHGNSLTLSAYNQEMYIEKTIASNVQIEGELVVNGKIFTDYTNKISSIDEIFIEKGLNNKLYFKYEKSSSEINYFEIQNFPDIGEYSEEVNAVIKESDLKELLERAIFCVAMNDNRIILKSCNIEVKDGIMQATCLDGYRVAISKKTPSEVSGDFKCMILGKIINDIMKILGDTDNLVKVCKYKNSVIFDLGHTKIRTTTVDGEFYNYESSIPKTIKTIITVNKNELAECLNRAEIISREHFYNNIIINVEDNVMNILAESEKGKVNENIDCKAEGDAIKIGLNNKYISDAISKIKEDFLRIKIENNTRPIIIEKNRRRRL